MRIDVDINKVTVNSRQKQTYSIMLGLQEEDIKKLMKHLQELLDQKGNHFHIRNGRTEDELSKLEMLIDLTISFDKDSALQNAGILGLGKQIDNQNK